MSGFEAVFLQSWKRTPAACSFIHPSSMPCQGHNLSVYIWFWYATTKNNWSFQTILTRRQNCLLGGMLVALRPPHRILKANSFPPTHSCFTNIIMRFYPSQIFTGQWVCDSLTSITGLVHVMHIAMKQHCLVGSWYALRTRCGGLKLLTFNHMKLQVISN